MTKSASVTSFDVARRAGVSRAAVSRSFTPGASVSETTRKKVLKAAEELGYRVNFIGRALQNKRTNFVAVLASRMDNPVRPRQIRELGERLLQNNMLPVLLISNGVEDFEAKIEEILQYQVSGIIVTSDTPPVSVARRCARQGTPLVTVNKDEMPVAVDRVLCGSERAGQEAATLFQAHGLPVFVAIRTANNSFTVNQRVDHFLSTAAAQGVQAVEIVVPDMSYEDGRLGAKLFMDQFPNPKDVGVFCAADYLALGFIDALKNRFDVTIPEDVQVIGFDDIAEAGRSPYALTTFHQDTLQMAKECVTLLKRRIEHPNAPKIKIDVESRLIVRRTTQKIN